MSTPCTTCGEPLDPTDGTCPTCGVTASPADETVVAVAAVDPTRTSEAPPWSIPIREPAAVAVAPTTHRRPRSLRLALLAVAVLAVAALLGTRLLDRDSGTTTGDTAQADPVGTDEDAGLDVAAIRTTTSTTTTAAPSTTTEPTTTTTAAPTTTAAAPAAPATTTTTASAARTGPNGTGSVPALSTSFRGWVAQLTSVPYSAGTAALADEWERLRAAVPGAVAARSDDWSAFRDGFWVLVDPGPFRTADEVRSFCAAAGFDGEGTCLPRELRG